VPGSTAFFFRNYGCNYGNDTTGKQGARALVAEAQNATRLVYESSPTAPNLALGDLLYGNVYGDSAYTTEGYTTNGGIANEFLLDNGLNAGKWYGFQFGVGMAHQWPAVRVGGVTPISYTSKPIKARLADIAAAVDIVVDYLAADGTVSTSAACTSAACTFSTDARQNYQYRVRYRNGSAATIATGSYAPVQ
jgi:hypothetical protein